ncbi:glycoside hydrolase family 76 protein [Parathielavia appendiculata]|uniref:Mannan endo-1,6-alpha-mannosidase n=1 Tax=Parathielavia appendiculata TaxID=2587402 RepID=A0AAN6U139_9PEZI|nr:glycoside hydrolase family 76 protein [Parathielavia appendiculata]
MASKAIALVGALLLAAAGVNGQSGKLDVDLDSPDSIKAAAKIVAKNLYNYYPGDQPGRTPGILPGPPPGGPYYWWQAGAMWGTFIDYWFYTGDDTYNAEATRSILFQADPPVNAFMPRNWTASLGNDDQAFWGMAAMLAAEVNFPNPPEDQPQWLALAQAVFNTQFPRWEVQDCNGGLRWQVVSTNGGYDYKNTIANACFVNLAARLGRYTNNATYGQWVDKAWDWMWGVGYITEDYNVLDGGRIPFNCTDLNPVQFSANAAILIHTTAIMYNWTEGAVRDIWRERTTKLVNRTIEHFFPDGIMVERPCELEDRVQCNTDQHSFKGYMHRALATAAVVAPFTRDIILKTLRSSTEGCVSSCLEDGTCGFRWTTGEYDGDVAHGPAGQQMSALAALSTLLIDQEKVQNGPLTNTTGGTSRGDPNAGERFSGLAPPKEITAGDRAGAAIVTVAVLASFLGSVLWMGMGWSES